MLKEKLHSFQLARQDLTTFHSSFDECHDMNQIYYKIWTIPYNKSVPYNNPLPLLDLEFILADCTEMSM